MRVLICTNFKKEKSINVLPEVVSKLTSLGLDCVMPSSVSEYFNDERVIYSSSENVIEESDVLVTVGGDGTILKWGKKAAALGKPLLGINTGRLGFMTALEFNETDKLSVLKTGDYSISRRMLINAELKSGEKTTCFKSLNDVVLFKELNSKLPEFVVKINGITVTKIRADGLIFSTPTGSTAYALSAGGPIIEPTIECIQLTPLCAHTLLNRPMIFSANDIVSVSYNSYEGSRVSISADGDDGIAFGDSDELILTKSCISLSLIDVGGNSFYNAVNNKLIQPIK